MGCDVAVIGGGSESGIGVSGSESGIGVSGSGSGSSSLAGSKFRVQAASVGLWIVLGISMILFNKVLLSYWGFGFPFALTLWHCLFASVTTQALVRSGSTFGREWGLLSSARDGSVTWQIYRTRILPLSLFFALGLTLGNSAYKYLSVAYIQMLKSMSPVLLLLLAFAIGKEKPSGVQLGLVAAICLGVMLASAGELHFSAVGATLQVGGLLGGCQPWPHTRGPALCS